MKILVLDTETLGLTEPAVYDLGYLIYDTADGNIIVARDYITREIYDDDRKMQTAYYYNKRPVYEERLADGYCKKVAWRDACRILKRDINKHKPDGIYAYNSRFDTRSIQTTCDLLKVKNPTADGIRDIWKGMTDPHITQTDDYKEFCRRNGFMTKHKKPRPQEKAETVYRYLTKQTDYQEEHTALEDSKIELKILLEVMSRRNPE